VRPCTTHNAANNIPLHSPSPHTQREFNQCRWLIVFWGKETLPQKQWQCGKVKVDCFFLHKNTATNTTVFCLTQCHQHPLDAWHQNTAMKKTMPHCQQFFSFFGRKRCHRNSPGKVKCRGTKQNNKQSQQCCSMKHGRQSKSKNAVA